MTCIGYLGNFWAQRHIIEVQHNEALARGRQMRQGVPLRKQRPFEGHACLPLQAARLFVQKPQSSTSNV